MSTTASTQVAQLTSCLTEIVSQDLEFAVCLMNTGVFTIPTLTSSRGRGTEFGIIANLLQNTSRSYASTLFESTAVTSIEYGNCQVHCTTPRTFGPSSSCCQAAAKVKACKSTNTNLSACKQVIQNGLDITHQCGVSGENIGLIVSLSLILLVGTILMIVSRRYARQQGKREIVTGLEARLTAGTATHGWITTFFSSWRQMTNLVWKNWILRRRKPISMVMEQLLPVLLVTGLLFLANLETIFWRESSVDNTEANFQPSKVLLCTGLTNMSPTTIGAPNDTMKTFYTSGQSVLGMFLVLSLIKFVSTSTTSMVMEKETKIREVMKIMGLTDTTLLLSWACTTGILSTPLALVLAGELKYGGVFPGEEYATLVFLFWSLSMSMVAFSYCITPFFKKSRTASIASVLIWLVFYFPYFSVVAKTNGTKYWAALSPPTAFAMAIDQIVRRAQLGTGIAFAIGSIQKPVNVPTAFHMSWMLLLDTVLLFALGWYFEQVIPQQYGVTKPWNFLFKRSFWIQSDRSKSMGAERERTPIMQTMSTDDAFSQSPRSSYSPAVDGSIQLPQLLGLSSMDNTTDTKTPYSEETMDSIEPVGPALAAQETKGSCLQIHDLRKVYTVEDGEKVAVHRLNLTFYSGHITALLGHNGAGKTTTISMLTGLTPPTDGDATLFNRSITRDFDQLRQIMGICPQHDVLYDDLTVEEHLILFGIMKNTSPQALKQQVDGLIQEVGLTEKRSVVSKTLSGGQKRKLSVAIAFIGDSKLVFLDEPTSGMDPYSRRFTWKVLKQRREDRVIVLTTHFMDEADILGDRIAIMADGKLCCAGRSLFLKHRYGAGYNLTMIKADGCNVDVVTRFVLDHVPEATVLSHYGSEIVFQLPTHASPVFSTMLHRLDGALTSLRIEQYGISVTTLEEVFLKIARDREDAVDHTEAKTHDDKRIIPRIATARTSRPTFWNQYNALFQKRIRITKRDKKSIINALAIPFLFLIILLLLPEIQVSNFLPNYTATLASSARQGNCTQANFTASRFTTSKQSNCLEIDFDYCRLGVIECNPRACCTQQNVYSPYYPCYTCTGLAIGDPCYNRQCLDREGAKLQVTLNAFLLAMVVTLAFSFIPAAIVAFIVREKNPIQNAKSLQLICGANISAYWFANWVHDVILITVSVITASIVIPLSARTLQSWSEIIGVVLVVASHALAVVPLAYLFSFRFQKHAVAQTSLLVFALCTGGLLSIFSFLCRIIDFEMMSGTSSSSSFTSSKLDRNYLRWIFLFFPGYALNNGIYEMATHKLSRTSLWGGDPSSASTSFFGLFEGLGKQSCTECWEANSVGCCIRQVLDLDVGGAPILYCLLEAVVFTYLVFRMERKMVIWNSTSSHPSRLHIGEDMDVAKERERVQQRSMSQDAIVIRNLRQEYSNGKVALDDLCLSIPKGECFGYLGINGAGKSTTMKILTGQDTPTSGFASLGGYDLAHARDQARTVLGYCPQFDSLHDLLTVTEQLELYARLKGIDGHSIQEAVDTKITEVGLEEYRDKLTRGLSGGNKRKVSTAIALMGSPRIIFLDEPSTGVDPSSRRKMWDVIAVICAEKESCVVLTTHSMEECEALCTRVGILVSGKLKCLGSVQHLKQKFGKGYTVEVKLGEPSPLLIQKMATEVERIIGSDTRIMDHNLEYLCQALGHEERGQQILDGEENGWELQSLLILNGFISFDDFATWFCKCNMRTAIIEFFEIEVIGSQLVEQQVDHFRFQVPKHSLQPFMIFQLLEDAKQRLCVNEYSVNDTSLEHIFNNMAAEQEEERLIPTSMYIGEHGLLEPSSIQSVRSYHRNSFNHGQAMLSNRSSSTTDSILRRNPSLLVMERGNSRQNV